MLGRLTLLCMLLGVLAYGCMSRDNAKSAIYVPDTKRGTTEDAVSTDRDGLRPFLLTPDKRLTSPTGRYELVSKKPNTAENYFGSIFLCDKATGRISVVVEEYTRDISALWSPDERCFALNDFYGSGESTCRVYSTRDPSNAVADIEKMMLYSEHRAPGTFPFVNNERRYIVALRWLSNDRLELTVYGKGEYNPKGYRAFIEYVIGRSFEHVRVHNGWN